MKYATLTIRNPDGPTDPDTISVRPEHVSYVRDHETKAGSWIVFGNGDRHWVEGSREEVDKLLEEVGDEVISKVAPLIAGIDEKVDNLLDRLEALEDMHHVHPSPKGGDQQ